MHSLAWFKARTIHLMPLILLNKHLLTFLYISFESSSDQYIYCLDFGAAFRQKHQRLSCLYFFVCA